MRITIKIYFKFNKYYYMLMKCKYYTQEVEEESNVENEMNAVKEICVRVFIVGGDIDLEKQTVLLDISARKDVF